MNKVWLEWSLLWNQPVTDIFFIVSVVSQGATLYKPYYYFKNQTYKRAPIHRCMPVNGRLLTIFSWKLSEKNWCCIPLIFYLVSVVICTNSLVLFPLYFYVHLSYMSYSHTIPAAILWWESFSLYTSHYHGDDDNEYISLCATVFAVLLQYSYESRYTARPRIWTMGNPASSFMPIETMLKPNTCLSLKRYT